MTRANINFIYQKLGHNPKTLYWYHNGDQYPRGIRDFYHVLDFVAGDWSIKSFEKWLGANYTETQSIARKSGDITIVSDYEPTDIPAKPRKLDHPCIYYDDSGYITDYSYIFDSTLGDKTVLVYEWDRKIFSGTASEFIKWITKQK